MFTSRAEYRLTLRADNADQRLTAIGLGWGCVGAARLEAYQQDRAQLEAAMARARGETFSAVQLRRWGLPARADGQPRSVFELLGQTELTDAQRGLVAPWLTRLSPRLQGVVAAEALYAGYLHRQDADIASFRRQEAALLDPAIDFARIGGLSTELREKLTTIRPASIGAAARIQGMTPAALVALMAHARRGGPAAA